MIPVSVYRFITKHIKEESYLRRIKGAVAAVLAAGLLMSTTAWAAEKEASSMQEVKGGTEIVQGSAGGLVDKVKLNESQQQAMEKIYQIIPELKELSVENVHDEGETAWGVFLSNRSGDAAPGIMYVNASLVFYNTGELIRFDIQNPDWASVELPTPGLAKEKAAQFAGRVLGDKIKDYQMSDAISYGGGSTFDDKGHEISWASASIQFDHLINGIPFLNSGIRVGVDAAGHVTEYYTEDYYPMQEGIKESRVDPAAFPAPSLAMTREAAEKVLSGSLEMKLNYVGRQPLKYPLFGNQKVATRPVLLYTPLNIMPIDAVTGKPLGDFQWQPQTSLINLTGEGKKLIARTPEEAASLIAAETGVDISGMKIAQEEERGKHFEPEIKVKEYIWRSDPPTGQDGQPDYSAMRYLYISALADTGQVVGFNIQDEGGQGKKGIVAWETALETAVQYVQRYLEQGAAELEMCAYPAYEESIPDWVDRSKLDGKPQPEFYFTFTRTHQGIPVSDCSYSVTVDGLTGRVTGFHDENSSSSVTLPDSKGAVTAEAAKAEFLKSHPLRLVYLWPEYCGQKAPEPLLVYMPDYGLSRGYIDALTGKTVMVEND